MGLKAALWHGFEAASLRPAIVTWWKPRLARIAEFIATAEREELRRENMNFDGGIVNHIPTAPSTSFFVLAKIKIRDFQCDTVEGR